MAVPEAGKCCLPCVPPRTSTRFSLKNVIRIETNRWCWLINFARDSVREAGGAMGKKGAAQEEMYFSKQNKDMKDKLKEHLKDEIKKHEDAIKASKELMNEIEK